MMNFVVWGADIVGKRTYDAVGASRVIAFIDNDKKKQGTFFYGIKVISYEEYKKNYLNVPIIIAMALRRNVMAIKEQLNADDLYNYFVFMDNPSEVYLAGEHGAIPFEEIVDDEIINADSIVISGMTLFSFLLYEYLANKKKKVRIVSSYNALLAGFVRHNYPEYYFCNEKEIDISRDIVLITDRSTGMKKEHNGLQNNEKLFYSFRHRESVAHHELEKFHDIAGENERCFIVATGPSLTVDDLNTLCNNNEKCFSMNRVYLIFDRTDWRPDYYVVADPDGLDLWEDDIISLNVKYKFFSDNSEKFWRENKLKISQYDNIFKYRNIEDRFGTEGPDVSDDIVYGTYSSGTVVTDCLQMAMYMGYKKIYLLGTDCTFDEDGNMDHFVDGYDEGIETTYAVDGEPFMEAYRNIHKYAIKHGIKIYNATRGGKLEEYMRVDFDSLFDN